MKLTIIVLLVVCAGILGFCLFSARKELIGMHERYVFYEKRNEELQAELIRHKKDCAENKKLLSEIEQNIKELESKIQLATLERYLPDKTWNEIKPIIGRLRTLRQEEEKHNTDEEFF
jgi:septal ring factor EnvC (AmiA/AmiB activator)